MTNDPAKSAAAIVERDISDREKLNQLTDKELLTQATRELAITVIIVSEILQREVVRLIPSKIGEVAHLVRSLGRALKATADGFRQTANMQSDEQSTDSGASANDDTDPLEEIFARLERERNSK